MVFYRFLHPLDKLTPTQSKQAQDYIKHKCSIKTIEDITGHVNYCHKTFYNKIKSKLNTKTLQAKYAKYVLFPYHLGKDYLLL